MDSILFSDRNPPSPRGSAPTQTRVLIYFLKFSGRHKYPRKKARRVNGQCVNTLIVVSCKKREELYVNSWNFGAY